jgi:hypothetical protein
VLAQRGIGHHAHAAPTVKRVDVVELTRFAYHPGNGIEQKSTD